MAMTPVTDVIRTERLVLRPLVPDDAEALFALFSNWEVVRWLSTPPWPYALEDARSFIAAQMDRAPDRRSYLAITLGGALIGGIDASSNRPAGAPPEAPVLGFWLGQPYWGRGFMSEAALAFTRRMFVSTGHDIIYSGAFAGNAASLRIQEKLGFVRTGETMHYSRPRGEKLAHISTELARARFLARYP
jgi:RimJ/RimL family protein N-acetyltransferase